MITKDELEVLIKAKNVLWAYEPNIAEALEKFLVNVEVSIFRKEYLLKEKHEFYPTKMYAGTVVENKLTELVKIFTKWYEGLKEKGWNSLFMNNHDQPRMISRFGDNKKYRVELAKTLVTLLHTLPGTLYVYQGEEIGMTNVAFDNIEDYRDIETLNFYHEMTKKGLPKEKIMEAIHRISRDNARTPMQWDDSPYAGFTTGTPWIKVNPNYPEINVAHNLKDSNSIFHYYQKIIQIRKENLIMIYGDYQLILEDDEHIYSYLRTLNKDRLLIILNFFFNQTIFNLPENINYKNKKLLISNYDIEEDEDIKRIYLRPYEARVYKLVDSE